MSENNPQQGFWNNLASQWNEGNKDVLVGWYEQHNQFEDYETILWKGIETGKDKLALEYGCGPGRNLIRFYGKFGRMDGVDISSEIIEKGKAWVNKNLGEVGNLPIMEHCDGQSIPFEDGRYHFVFSVICMQHINSRPKRLAIYKEIHRVLKPGGIFTAQMGFGPGHPKSVDYFNENEVPDADGRVEDPLALKDDLAANGLIDFKYELREPNHDVHPQWIWFQVRKESA